jgi:xanthine/CO dehydrogenase XdhC/CoxF family maturation factor
MPIGVNIQTETPYEIAISIMAKIIDVKNKRKNK